MTNIPTEAPDTRAGATNSNNRKSIEGRSLTSSQESVKNFNKSLKALESKDGAREGEPLTEPQRLCDLFAAGLTRLGLPTPPTTPAAWLNAAAELIVLRGTAKEVEQTLSWLSRSEYWRSRILTMQAFLTAYPRLRLQGGDEGEVAPPDRIRNRVRDWTPTILAMRASGFPEEEIAAYVHDPYKAAPSA